MVPGVWILDSGFGIVDSGIGFLASVDFAIGFLRGHELRHELSLFSRMT